jgi:SnoaL-like domain
MDHTTSNRRSALPSAAAATATAASNQTIPTQESNMSDTRTFTRAQPPQWLLDFWKEIDEKTWGQGFDCFTDDATAHLGVSDWHGREAIRANLRAFVDKGFTAHHDVVEYWDGGSLKVFRGFVTMKPNDPAQPTVKPAMTHFFYMDKKDPTKVAQWYGSVGPVAF